MEYYHTGWQLILPFTIADHDCQRSRKTWVLPILAAEHLHLQANSPVHPHKVMSQDQITVE
jgi:hypothetical protein